MLEYDRIDISEGIDVNKKMHQKNVIFVTIGILKIMSLLFMLKEVLKEFTFGRVPKVMQLVWWTILIWSRKKVFYNFFFCYV